MSVLTIDANLSADEQFPLPFSINPPLPFLLSLSLSPPILYSHHFLGHGYRDWGALKLQQRVHVEPASQTTFWAEKGALN